MARLGRQRREAARISRGRPITTATPLVRRRLLLKPDGANSAWRWYGRIKRGRRPQALTARAPSTPTATPLARKRQLVSMDRRPWLRRRRARIVGRAPKPAPVAFVRRRALVTMDRRPWQRRHRRPLAVRSFVATLTGRPSAVRLQPRANRVRAFRRRTVFVFHGLRAAPAAFQAPRLPLIGRAAVRASMRLHSYRRRARLGLGPSTPTATPLVRQRLVAVQGRRSWIRGRWSRQRTRLLARSRTSPAIVFVRATLIASKRRRVTRTRRAHATLLRSIVQPAARHVPLLSRKRPLRFRRNRRLLVRPPAVRLAVVTRTAPKLVRVSNRRAATRRSFYGRHRLRLATSTLGSDRPLVIVVGSFDPSTAAENLLSSPTAAAFDAPRASVDEHGAPAAQTFDSPSPHF